MAGRIGPEKGVLIETLEETAPVRPPDQSVWTDPVVWLVLAVIFFGSTIPFFIPVTLSIFHREFGATLKQMGLMQVGFYTSALGLAAGGGWMVNRLGHRRALTAVLLLLAGALTLIGSARSFLTVVVGAFGSGLGVLSIVVITSAIITERFSVKRQAIFYLHGLSGAAGSIAGPAVLGWWFANAERFGGNWREAYWFVAIILAALAFWPLFLPRGALPEKSKEAQEEANGLAALKAVLRRPEIYLICLLTIVKSIPSGGMISFIGLFYQKKLGVSVSKAALFLSASAAGIFVGRSLLSWITARRHLPDLRLFAVCMGGATLAYAGTIASPSYGGAVVMFGLSGVFFSGSGPALNSYCGARFALHASTAFSLMAGISYLGGAGGSFMIGQVATRAGLERGMWTLPASALLVTLLGAAWSLREKPHVP